MPAMRTTSLLAMTLSLACSTPAFAQGGRTSACDRMRRMDLALLRQLTTGEGWGLLQALPPYDEAEVVQAVAGLHLGLVTVAGKASIQRRLPKAVAALAL